MKKTQRLDISNCLVRRLPVAVKLCLVMEAVEAALKACGRTDGLIAKITLVGKKT